LSEQEGIARIETDCVYLPLVYMLQDIAILISDRVGDFLKLTRLSRNKIAVYQYQPKALYCCSEQAQIELYKDMTFV
jgi:hypothetical protein